MIKLLTLLTIILLSSNGFAQANYQYRWKKIADQWTYRMYIDTNSIKQSGDSYSYINKIDYLQIPEGNPDFPVTLIRSGVANCRLQTNQYFGGLGYANLYGQGPGVKRPAEPPVNISEAALSTQTVYEYFCK